MKQDNLIFLFTCVFNDRKHINKLFESIKTQTANNFVYYMYDDASNESYEDLFKDLKDKLEQKGIKCYYEKGEKNLGINKATEHCLTVLRDKFKKCTHFAWINSDDWLTDRYIETISKNINKHPDYSVYIPNIIQHKESNNVEKIMYTNKEIKNSHNYLRDFFYFRQIYSHFVVNKNSFIKINPSCLIFDNSNFKNFYNDDCILFLLSAFNQKSLFINKPLSYFLIKTDNASNIANNNRLKKTMFLKYFRQYISEINNEYLATYDAIINIIFTYFVCQKLMKYKKFNYIKNLYNKQKTELFNLNLDKKYLNITNHSIALYKFPKITYNTLKLIKRL